MKLRQFSIDRLDSLLEEARLSPRRRLNLNVHPNLDDPIQRMFNVMHPGAYFRPHRHQGAHRWEMFTALRGAAVVLLFDGKGVVSERVEIAASGPNVVVEIPPLAWHTLAVLEPDTVLLELKPGPYLPLEDKDFAIWAPAEGDDRCSAFVEFFEKAAPGCTAPEP